MGGRHRSCQVRLPIVQAEGLGPGGHSEQTRTAGRVGAAEKEGREPWKIGRVPQRGPELRVVRGRGEQCRSPSAPPPRLAPFFPVGGLSMFGRTRGSAEGRWGATQTRGHQEPGLTSPWVALSPVDWCPPHLCGL